MDEGMPHCGLSNCNISQQVIGDSLLLDGKPLIHGVARSIFTCSATETSQLRRNGSVVDALYRACQRVVRPEH
jgi:hypothetical protein